MLKYEHTDRFTFIILENKYHLLAMLSWLKEGQTHFYFQKPNFLEAAEGVKDGICSITELFFPVSLQFTSPFTDSRNGNNLTFFNFKSNLTKERSDVYFHIFGSFRLEFKQSPIILRNNDP